ncbi:MAG: anti-anti-sigma factor [Saprospiraceae bacterium]|jgi:anti-sigma B factor antagonist|tara:strand:+ start:2849 stop:3223 length:375 start_codon:yes stop_codon:yes gene_type:complete
MKYAIDKQEHYAVMSLQEENLNSMLAPNLKSELIILRNEGIENLVLNLEDVKFVDSSGLSAILTANRLWNGVGYFILTGVKHPSVSKLIAISRLDTILNIKTDVKESIDLIMMDDLESELEADS